MELQVPEIVGRELQVVLDIFQEVWHQVPIHVTQDYHRGFQVLQLLYILVLRHMEACL